MHISQLISKIADSDDKDAVAQLDAMFVRSFFGLRMKGLRTAEPGEPVIIGDSDSVTMQLVSDVDGRKMIRACADPDLFEAMYPGSVNTRMEGEELLKMALKLPEVD